MSSSGTVHVKQTIVVEYDAHREEFEDGAGVVMSDADIREAASLPPWEIWPDLGQDLVTSHSTEVTFR